MAVEQQFLKRIPYFLGLGQAELESLRRVVFEKTVEKGEMVLLEEGHADGLYFVASGVVKVFKTSAEGKEQILKIVRPVESFNDVPSFDDGPNPASAQAMVPVVLYGIRKSDMQALLRENTQIALNVINVLAGQVRHLVSVVEDLSFRHVIGRIARILLEHADGGAGAQRLTQQEMASIAGTAREVVGRSLKALGQGGLIRMERHRIVITDKEGLEKMVKASS